MKKLHLFSNLKSALYRFGFFLLIALWGLIPACSFAQGPVAEADSTRKIKIEYSDLGETFVRGQKEIRKLSGNVRLRQDKVLIYTDTAIIIDNDAILRGHVILEQEDTVNVFADSCWYFGNTKQSDLFGDVVLKNGIQQLFTNKLHYDVGNKIATYHQGATMSNGKTQLQSRHGYYYVNTDEVFFKEDVLVTDPEFTVRTDTMSYRTDIKTVHFLAPTLISQRESRIYTEGGFYDIENGFAEFDKNPQYEKGKQRGRARKMRYISSSNEYILDGDAYIEEGKQKIDADIIRYNTETEIANLEGNAHYRDSLRNISGPKIRYDGRNKSYQLVGRSQVVDGSSIIEAEHMDFNDVLGNGWAEGDVVYTDTASKYILECQRADFNKNNSYVNAFGGAFGQKRPLMKILIDRDTLFMRADTLTSYKRTAEDSVRLLLAHRDVRMYKSDLQAVCDSLSYSTLDSTFWFYTIDTLPLMWSDTSQFSGDTIRMQLKNKKLHRIWLDQNAWVINSEDGKMFNQIKGRRCVVDFRDNQAREMLVNGNAEAVYYALDEKRAYVGVNETQCSYMRLFFGDNKVEDIKFYSEPTGKFSPMKKVGRDGIVLKGFFWEKSRRPRGVSDL